MVVVFICDPAMDWAVDSWNGLQLWRMNEFSQCALGFFPSTLYWTLGFFGQSVL